MAPCVSLSGACEESYVGPAAPRGGRRPFDRDWQAEAIVTKCDPTHRRDIKIYYTAYIDEQEVGMTYGRTHCPRCLRPYWLWTICHFCFYWAVERKPIGTLGTELTNECLDACMERLRANPQQGVSCSTSSPHSPYNRKF